MKESDRLVPSIDRKTLDRISLNYLDMADKIVRQYSLSSVLELASKEEAGLFSLEVGVRFIRLKIYDLNAQGRHPGMAEARRRPILGFPIRIRDKLCEGLDTSQKHIERGISTFVSRHFVDERLPRIIELAANQFVNSFMVQPMPNKGHQFIPDDAKITNWGNRWKPEIEALHKRDALRPEYV